MRTHVYLFNECRPSFEILPVSKYVYVYWACVISRSSDDGLGFKEDLICLTKFSVAAKFVENFIFVRGIGEKKCCLKFESIVYILKHWHYFVCNT